MKSVTTTNSNHQTLGYAAYGLLGLPLAMVALPVYVQIPVYYTSQLGLSLATTGWVLFLARLIDTVQDPLLGRLIDRLRGGLNTVLIVAATVLALAFLGLWLPPVTGGGLALWLGLMLIMAYIAHSTLNITYLAWGARIQASQSSGDGVLLGAAAWREGAGLVGVIVASVIPSMIMAGSRTDVASNMGWYSLGFALILMLAMLALLRAAPAWQRTQTSILSLKNTYQLMSKNQAFRRLLPPYFLNALSISIPATLVLFFINDRIQAPTYAGAFLATYFIAGAIGLPIWVKLANRIGVISSWRIGMLLAITAFFSASLLQSGDIAAYFLVCLAAGLSLGADLALPPVLLAKVIAQDEPPALYYGIWTLIGKLALAFSGLALPLLAQFDYQSGHAGSALLAWIYAGVPCGFKLIALLLLMRSSQQLEVTQS